MTTETKIEQALVALSQSADLLKASIAWALLPAAAAPKSINVHDQKEIKARLFALISRQAAVRKDPIAVVEALVCIDEHLSATAGMTGPFACRFAPTAAELVNYVENTERSERLEIQTAELAPIFPVGKKTLCAVLASPVGQNGAALFTDRVLREALHKKPSHFRIIVRMKASAAAEIADLLAALYSELEEQCIAVIVEQSFAE